MEDKQILLNNIDKVHTTEMGIDRIKKNLKLDTNDVVEYCKNKVLDKNCNIYKQGKNWYCEIENIIITINSYSYTIITAHIIYFNINIYTNLNYYLYSCYINSLYYIIILC